MSTRIVFDREFAHAIRIRGLTIGELAKRARLSQAPPSAAVHGKPLNSRRWTLLRSKKATQTPPKAASTTAFSATGKPGLPLPQPISCADPSQNRWSTQR
jgi:hypothetical protein